MKPRIKRNLFPVLLLVAAVIVFLNAWWALQAIRTLATNAYWLAHSWQVVHQVERVLGSAVNAETGERGYLISGQDSYLEPYTTARQERDGSNPRRMRRDGSRRRQAACHPNSHNESQHFARTSRCDIRQRIGF